MEQKVRLVHTLTCLVCPESKPVVRRHRTPLAALRANLSSHWRLTTSSTSCSLESKPVVTLTLDDIEHFLQPWEQTRRHTDVKRHRAPLAALRASPSSHWRLTTSSTSCSLESKPVVTLTLNDIEHLLQPWEQARRHTDVRRHRSPLATLRANPSSHWR